MPAMGSLRVLVVDVLFAAAVLVGVLWAVVWLDVAPGPQEEVSPIPAGLGTVAAVSAGLVLVPALLGAAAWWGGHRAARPLAVLTGAALIGTGPGWERVANAALGREISVMAGVLLLVLLLPRLYVPPVRMAVGRPGRRGRRGRPGRLGAVALAPLLPVLVTAGGTARFGWTLRVVNRPEEGETGWPYLLAGLAVCAACLVAGARLLGGRRPGGAPLLRGVVVAERGAYDVRAVDGTAADRPAPKSQRGVRPGGRRSRRR
jgi:hypothetical protein